MNKLLGRKKENRKPAAIHGIPSSNTASTPDTPNPRNSIQTLYVSFLSDLSHSDTCSLACILHAKNFNGSNVLELDALMEALPPHLRSGRGIIDKLPKSITDLPDPALLCAAHKPLNARVIRNILNLVKEEAGFKLSTLIAYGELSNRHRQILNTVRDIHTLWMKQADFAKNIKGSASGKWKYELTRCEACILSKIGADDETLTALRTALLSRTQTKNPKARPPTLLRWVEAWIDTGIAAGAKKVEIRYQSAEECKSLKEARKLAHARRKSAEARMAGKGRRKLSHPRQQLRPDAADSRHRNQPGTSTSKKVEDPFTDPQTRANPRPGSRLDVENEIIDEYGNFLSPEFLPTDSVAWLDLNRKPEEHGRTHPAFRVSDSVEVADEKGMFPGQSQYVPIDREALRKKLREETCNVWDEIGKGKGKGKAEVKAEEYRSLLGEEGDESDWDDASVYSGDEMDDGEGTLVGKSSRDDAGRITKWEDFYRK